MSNYRTVNLEHGMPAVCEASNRLNREIKLAKKHKISVLKLIHGFGSSGKGGKIRLSVRNEVEKMKKQGFISDIIYGEKFSIFDSTTQTAIKKCSQLSKDSDLERHNNGVTFLIL